MKVVIIHLDGMGFNYFKKSNLEFAKSLKGKLFRMKINPGYFTNEVSLFTGISEKIHKTKDLFDLGLPSNPFNNNFTNFIPQKLIRFFAFLFGYKTYININPPKHYYKLFSPVTKIHPYNLPESFLTILKSKGIKTKYISSLFFNLGYIKNSIKKNDCVYANNMDYDNLLHCYGPNYFPDTGIDTLIEDLYIFLAKTYKEFRVIILSDHGMVNVKGKIPINLKEDQISFVDSTILRTWNYKNFNRNIKNTELLESGYDGTYHYKRYVAKEGFIFSPNFFQGTKSIKGMHGYNSKNDSDNDAFLLIHGPSFENQTKKCRIVDVAPTILSLFGINKPSFMEGRVL
mgnify:CR=1 FL=1